MSDFKKQFKSGIIVNFIGNYSQVLIELVITAILARLLSPADFGIVSIVFVFLAFFNILSNIGIGVSVVQFRDLNKNEVSTLNNLSILIGLIASFLFAVSNTFIADFYHESIYSSLVPLMAIVILLNSARAVPEGIMRKEQRFKIINLITLISNLLGGIIAVILAFLGYGVFALIYKSIITNLILLIAISTNSCVKYDLSFSKNTIKKVLGFSFNQFMFNLVNYFTRNIDTILIAKIFGSEALGFYDRAYKLTRYPLDNMKAVVGPVLHPILSQYQNDKNIIINIYLKLLKFFSLFFIPLTSVLLILGDELILLFYGKGWEESIPIFKLLIITAGLQALSSTTGSIFQSFTRTDVLFKTGVVINIFTVGGILIGLVWGTYGVAIGFSIGYTISFFIVFYMLFKLMGIKYIEFFKILTVPIVISVLLFIMLLPVDNILSEEKAIYRLLVLGVLSILFYIILLKLFRLDKLIGEVVKRKK